MSNSEGISDEQVRLGVKIGECVGQIRRDDQRKGFAAYRIEFPICGFICNGQTPRLSSARKGDALTLKVMVDDIVIAANQYEHRPDFSMHEDSLSLLYERCLRGLLPNVRQSTHQIKQEWLHLSGAAVDAAPEQPEAPTEQPEAPTEQPESPTPDTLKAWGRSNLITPGRVYHVVLPRPEGDAPKNCTPQTARIEIVDGVLKASIKGEHSGHVKLTLGPEARRVFAAIMAEGLT